uniref:Serine and arginine rich splicing factor 5b n=1 Tax=Salmo trutta TaxID=8032 RepID=A0A673YB00_SALTR
MSGCRIFVGRLNPSAREKDVERFFKGYGRIRDIDLKRGFGFVEFDDPRDAEDAVYELDGKELCNERVTIEHARVRLRGGRGRGGDRGGGGGGGGGGRFPDRYGRGSQDSRRNPPPMRTENRLIVENLSSRVSWQPDCCVVWTRALLMVELTQSGSLSLEASIDPYTPPPPPLPPLPSLRVL